MLLTALYTANLQPMLQPLAVALSISCLAMVTWYVLTALYTVNLHLVIHRKQPHCQFRVVAGRLCVERRPCGCVNFDSIAMNLVVVVFLSLIAGAHCRRGTTTTTSSRSPPKTTTKSTTSSRTKPISFNSTSSTSLENVTTPWNPFTDDDNSTESELNETSTVSTTMATTSTTDSTTETSTSTATSSRIATTAPTTEISSEPNIHVDTSSHRSSSGSDAPNWIIGVAAGAIIGVGLLIALTLVLVARKQRKKAKKDRGSGEGSDVTTGRTTMGNSSRHGDTMVRLEPGLWAMQTTMDVTVVPSKVDPKISQTGAKSSVPKKTVEAEPMVPKSEKHLSKSRIAENGATKEALPMPPKEAHPVIHEPPMGESAEQNLPMHSLREAPKTLDELQPNAVKSETPSAKSMGLKQKEFLPNPGPAEKKVKPSAPDVLHDSMSSKSIRSVQKHPG